jgi:hypothetical protein
VRWREWLRGCRLYALPFFAYRVPARPPFRSACLDEATADSIGQHVGLGERGEREKYLYRTALDSEARAAADSEKCMTWST